MQTSVRVPEVQNAGVLSIAVIGPDERRRSAVAQALEGCQTYQVRQFTSYPHILDDSAQMLKRNYHIVFIELDSDPEFALDLVESICVRGSGVVIVYAEQSNPDLLVRCMRAGVREFLTLPLGQYDMADALMRASAHRPAAPPPPPRTNGCMHVFLGAKGGTGVTTLASNFAVSLAQESARNTLLIDLNLPLGDAAIGLGVRAKYSTVDALQNAARLDKSLFSTMLVRHECGLAVLAAPTELAPCEVTPEAIDKILTVARTLFDYVVVDLGSRLELQNTALFHQSATLHLVTQIGIPELRNANRLITEFSQEGSPRLEIVLNRFDAGTQSFPEEQINKALTRPPDWKVPNNYAAVRRMQNTATPLALEDSSVARMIRQMARAACGKMDIVEKKKRFSFFG